MVVLTSAPIIFNQTTVLPLHIWFTLHPFIGKTSQITGTTDGSWRLRHVDVSSSVRFHFIQLKECMMWDLPGSLEVMTLCIHCMGTGLIPGWGTKILNVVWCTQKKKKNVCVCVWCMFSPKTEELSTGNIFMLIVYQQTMSLHEKDSLLLGHSPKSEDRVGNRHINRLLNAAWALKPDPRLPLPPLWSGSLALACPLLLQEWAEGRLCMRCHLMERWSHLLKLLQLLLAQ